jgi:hypothetical protein
MFETRNNILQLLRVLVWIDYRDGLARFLRIAKVCVEPPLTRFFPSADKIVANFSKFWLILALMG